MIKEWMSEMCEFGCYHYLKDKCDCECHNKELLGVDK